MIQTGFEKHVQQQSSLNVGVVLVDRGTKPVLIVDL